MDIFRKRLREEIRALRESINAIRDQQERHYQAHQAERTLAQPPIRVDAEIHEQKDPTGKKKPNSNDSFAYSG